MAVSLGSSRRNRIAASPRARRVMRERGIDPSSLRGTGPNGRIVEADVIKGSGVFSAARRAMPAMRPAGGLLSPMRRAVAAKVSESFATVPHFYLRSEIDVTALMDLRGQVAEAIEQSCGQRPILTDFLLRAMALGLRDCPQANRIWQDGTIVQLPTVDVGLVVQVEDGLLVPILHGADQLSLSRLVAARAELLAGLRSGRAAADLFQGGSISLTNLGKRRVDEFAAIISPPQSMMLATGRVAERPAVHEGRLCVRQTMCATLSVDHRVMDGIPAAEYFDRVVEYLEKPFLLFCDTPAGGCA
jgi:pyruvate dehydrogenase E2 component (dihydrolipoamide acetyltransferase)